MNYRDHFDSQWVAANAPNQVWIRVRLLVGAVCDLGLGHVSPCPAIARATKTTGRHSMENSHDPPPDSPCSRLGHPAVRCVPSGNKFKPPPGWNLGGGSRPLQ